MIKPSLSTNDFLKNRAKISTRCGFPVLGLAVSDCGNVIRAQFENDAHIYEYDYPPTGRLCANHCEHPLDLIINPGVPSREALVATYTIRLDDLNRQISEAYANTNYENLDEMNRCALVYTMAISMLANDNHWLGVAPAGTEFKIGAVFNQKIAA